MLKPETLKTLYTDALERGREVARSLVAKRNAKQLESPPKRRGLFAPAQVCPECGKKAPKGATFCAFCGKPLLKIEGGGMKDEERMLDVKDEG
ncbi:MAG: zinc-ribbon domain [Chloroflexi bacterium]|nr:zinc-ribbon domain [Chloroflexota bacterium]